MRSYETARRMFGFLEFTSWLVVGLGVILVIYGLGNLEGYGRASGIPAIGFGIFLAYAGLVGAANVQNGRASVDSAEYGQQQLKIAREQLEISRQALRAQLDGREAATYEANSSKSFELPTKASDSDGTAKYTKETAPEIPKSERANPNGFVEHKGQTIEVSQLGFVVSGKLFGTMEKAKEYIEANPALPKTLNASPAVEALLNVGNEPSDASARTEEEQENLGKTEVGFPIYKGINITNTDGKYFVGEAQFDSLKYAQEFIDRMPDQSE